MYRLRYVSASTNDQIELDGKITYSGIAKSFRAKRFLYTLEGLSLSNVRRAASEVTLEITTSLEEADRISPIFDADTGSNTPGTFYSDGWEQRGCVVKTELEDISLGKCKLTLTVVLLDGAWHKLTQYVMRQASGDSRGTKIYPYTYPYYYSTEFGFRYLENPSPVASNFRFVIFGPAISPEIRIGGNDYSFACSVPSGGYLLVESFPEASVILVDSDGNRTDMFYCAERGTGEGCGTYAFELLPPGISNVSWSDMFGFDLYVYEERGDLPYAASSSG